MKNNKVFKNIKKAKQKNGRIRENRCKRKNQEFEYKA